MAQSAPPPSAGDGFETLRGAPAELLSRAEDPFRIPRG